MFMCESSMCCCNLCFELFHISNIVLRYETPKKSFIIFVYYKRTEIDESSLKSFLQVSLCLLVKQIILI